MNTDKARAAVIATIQSLLPVLILLGVVNWTSDQVAIVMLFVTNAVTTGFLLAPNPTPPPAS